ncbi:unnamed protein product [Rotaria magnacalcarata]|uniref:Uncharacterized protein n=2 Tax=Rotaria magnacalcarata TaxID=392030 RepID=A0A815GN75_9BILA|nr:unnamed protein product [Rotaria magnacalcarata]
MQLTSLNAEIHQNPDDCGFMGTGKEHWTKELERLKATLNNPYDFTIRQDSSAFISKIYLQVERNESNQLKHPTDVLIDKETDSLIICDYENRRVVRWSRSSGITKLEIVINNIKCVRLAMGEQRCIRVSVVEGHEVRRYQLGYKNGTLVAGGNGNVDGLNELIWPKYLFVDREQNVYVSDTNNHRVMK